MGLPGTISPRRRFSRSSPHILMSWTCGTSHRLKATGAPGFSTPLSYGDDRPAVLSSSRSAARPRQALGLLACGLPNQKGPPLETTMALGLPLHEPAPRNPVLRGSSRQAQTPGQSTNSHQFETAEWRSTDQYQRMTQLLRWQPVRRPIPLDSGRGLQID